MSALALTLRRMLPEDLDDVWQLDQLSFSLPWSRRSFEFELKESLVSSCWVAELPPQPRPDPLYLPWSEGKPLLVGMIVSWLIEDEAHVATFAIHPYWRRHGLGRLLLQHALTDAQARGCTYVALEVRSGNAGAIRLYESFGFVQVGLRPGYYHDTHEDALLLQAPLPISNPINPLEEGG